MGGKVSMLSEVIEALPEERDELKVTVDTTLWDEFITELCQPISYNQTVRGNVPCLTKKGKKTRAHFCVWITRTDNGFYEYGCNT